jgi:hypothetical protein
MKKLVSKISALCLIGAIAVFTACQDVTGSAADVAAGLFDRNAAVVKVNPKATGIYNQAGLAAIQNNPAGDYVLCASFTLTNWTPICNPSTGGTPFTGRLYGDDNTITILSFDQAAVNTSPYLGIFATSGSQAIISDLNVVIATSALTSPTAQWVAGVVAYAQSTTFIDVVVSGVLNVTSEIPAPSTPGGAWKTVNGIRVINVNATTNDGLNVGGIVGYGKYVSVLNAITKGEIIAISENTAVFAGGVAGFTDYTSISNVTSNSSVTGNGPGYNTSAGGVAGYIVSSHVTDSFALGNINLRALGVDFGWSDSWQIDAGGLVGYAGGAEDGTSSITHSYATGDVYAYAPFPYAGGLVGYIYGYNNFSDPAKNGTFVSRSWATGDVISESQPDPNKNYGDIPYAGGLAGYSSVTGSTIEDCYATGSATARTNGTYAWAGGIIGGNANDAVVNRTYATGNVVSYAGGALPPIYAPDAADPGPAAGGIAGFNYYSTVTTVKNSVALNRQIYGNNGARQQPVVHRVVGSIGTGKPYPQGSLDNNYAFVDMRVGDYWQQDFGLNRVDGANTSAPPPKSFYDGTGSGSTLSWDFTNVWQMTGAYPTLR